MATSLYKVATGSKDASGQTVYDVFGGANATDHISDPNDSRLSGVDIKSLPEGTAPAGFKSQFLPVDGSAPAAQGGVSSANLPADTSTNLADYYKSLGQSLPTLQNRAGTFEKYGLGTAANYLGTATQNAQLLSALKSNKSKFETGFDQANAATGNKAMDVSGGDAAELIKTYSPPKTNDTSSLFVQSDGYMNDLVKSWQEYINPNNQRASLSETYKQMVQDSGIQDLDLELVDMKNVIDGTEDDLRNEITKAGGFATESQVQALSNARNKQLIKNYNTLLDTRNAKEKYLNTALQLEQADRQATDQRFESMFNMGMQIADYQQKMANNARTQMQWVAQNIGFDGLYDSTNGDPYYTKLVEQTLGLPSGGLKVAADQAVFRRLAAQQKADLETQTAKMELSLKAEQIKTEQAQRAKIVADTQKIIEANKGTIFDPTTPAGKKGLALGKSKIDQVNSILSSGNLNTAVGPNAFSRYGSWRNLFRPGASNFIGDVEQLRSQLNLQSLIDAKSQGATFGALSDQELQMLSSSATKIGTWAVKDGSGNVTGYKVKESDFKRELDKINNFAKLDYIYKGGSPEDVGVQVLDGRYYTKNSDGTITEL